MIRIAHKGNFTHTENFFKRALKKDYLKALHKYGEAGVKALASATPRDTGYTASCWGYEIEEKKGTTILYWTNSNIQNGVPIAVILQYGHGTRNGGYVQGRDYINPALRPIFDKIASSAWEEVVKE